MARPARVVQTGTYSFWNKGDAAMQLSARSAFNDVGIAVVVSTPFPEHDRALYADSVCRSRRRNLVLGPLLVIAGLLWRLLRRVGVPLPILVADGEGRAMSSSAAVVDLSGDMLTESHGS